MAIIYGMVVLGYLHAKSEKYAAHFAWSLNKL